MKSKVILAFLVFQITLVARAENQIPCIAKTWKLNADLPLREIKSNLDKKSRDEILQLAWGEMLKEDQKKSVALPVLQYLSGTESDPRIRGYFKSMAMSMTGGVLPNKAIDKWPTRIPTTKNKFSLKQLCELYSAANKGD